MIEHTELMKDLAWMGFGYMLGMFLISIGRMK